MNAALAGPEKAKLDQHLESIRLLEDQFRGLSNAGECNATTYMPAAKLTKRPHASATYAAHVNICSVAALLD